MSNRQNFAEYNPIELCKDDATHVLPTSRANTLSISSFKEGKIADGYGTRVTPTPVAKHLANGREDLAAGGRQATGARGM